MRKIINASDRLTVVKVVIFNEMTLEIASISMTPTFWESHKICRVTFQCQYYRQISFHMANRIKKATIRQKRPIASDRANPRIAYENSCCFREGFLKESEGVRPFYLYVQDVFHTQFNVPDRSKSSYFPSTDSITGNPVNPCTNCYIF